MDNLKLKILFLLLIILISLDISIAIGISPPRIIAENLNRGSHFEKQIYLSGISPGQEIDIKIEGEMGDWIGIDKGINFIFPEDIQSLPLTISIDVPSNAQNGDYTAALTIFANPQKDDSGLEGVKATVIAAVSVDITAKVTGEQVKDYKVLAIAIPNTEENIPLNIVLTIENNGNVVAGPSSLHIDIWDKLRESIIFSKDASKIPPVSQLTKGTSVVSIEHTLTKEQYWADIVVYEGNDVIYNDKIIFDVLEEDSLKKSGTLKQINAPKSVNKDEIVKINAVFTNTGDLGVSAKFIGEIHKKGKLIGVVESEPSFANIASTESLIAYFTPTDTGKYTISGHVVYANKKTDTKETTFTVGGNGILGPVLIVSAIALVLLIVVILIIRRYNEH